MQVEHVHFSLFFQSRKNDANRLANRGGALLKEEKIRKGINKELPKVTLISYHYDNVVCDCCTEALKVEMRSDLFVSGHWLTKFGRTTCITDKSILLGLLVTEYCYLFFFSRCSVSLGAVRSSHCAFF